MSIPTQNTSSAQSRLTPSLESKLAPPLESIVVPQVGALIPNAPTVQQPIVSASLKDVKTEWTSSMVKMQGHLDNMEILLNDMKRLLGELKVLLGDSSPTTLIDLISSVDSAIDKRTDLHLILKDVDSKLKNLNITGDDERVKSVYQRLTDAMRKLSNNSLQSTSPMIGAQRQQLPRANGVPSTQTAQGTLSLSPSAPPSVQPRSSSLPSSAPPSAPSTPSSTQAVTKPLIPSNTTNSFSTPNSTPGTTTNAKTGITVSTATSSSTATPSSTTSTTSLPNPFLNPKTNPFTNASTKVSPNFGVPKNELSINEKKLKLISHSYLIKEMESLIGSPLHSIEITSALLSYINSRNLTDSLDFDGNLSTLINRLMLSGNQLGIGKSNDKKDKDLIVKFLPKYKKELEDKNKILNDELNDLYLN